jgi:hypothetical protein
MLPAGFKPAIPAIRWPQSHVQDCTAIGIGYFFNLLLIIILLCGSIRLLLPLVLIMLDTRCLKCANFLGFSVAQLRCPVFWNVAATHTLQKNGVLHWSTSVRNWTSSIELTHLLYLHVYIQQSAPLQTNNIQKKKKVKLSVCVTQPIKWDPKNSK